MNLLVKAGIAVLGGAVIFVGINGLEKNRSEYHGDDADDYRRDFERSDDGWRGATNGLRDTQTAISKLGSLAGTLTTTVEMLGQLFSVRPLSGVNPTTIIL